MYAVAFVLLLCLLCCLCMYCIVKLRYMQMQLDGYAKALGEVSRLYASGASFVPDFSAQVESGELVG